MNFSAEDLRQLKRLGIDPARATRQINLLRTGQIDIKLERPCIVGDGIIYVVDITVCDGNTDQG